MVHFFTSVQFVQNYAQVELVGRFEHLDKGDLHAPPLPVKGLYK